MKTDSERLGTVSRREFLKEAVKFSTGAVVYTACIVDSYKTTNRLKIISEDINGENAQVSNPTTIIDPHMVQRFAEHDYLGRFVIGEKTFITRVWGQDFIGVGTGVFLAKKITAPIRRFFMNLEMELKKSEYK